jgi:glc operon protein GlcG
MEVPRALSLDRAQRAVDVALAEASARGLRIAVAVTGTSGDLIAFARMDGVAPLAAETARRKCSTVGLTWKSTAEFAAMLRDGQAREPHLPLGMLSIGEAIAIGGGVPVRAGSQLIGAIGVSGASSDEDDALAQTAADAIEAAEPQGEQDR